MAIFNHVQVKVKDLKMSRKFYDCAMAALGYKVVLEINDVVIDYGTSVHDMFEIRQFDAKSLLSTIAAKKQLPSPAICLNL